MASSPTGTVPDTSPGFDRLLDTLVGELDVVFPKAPHIARACTRLREAAGAWTDPWLAERLARLAPPLHRRSGAFQRPVLDLLGDAARAVPRPWPLIEALLASRDEGVCASVLEILAGRVAAGTLTIGGDELALIAELGERDGSPLFGAACLSRIAALMPPVAGEVAAAGAGAAVSGGVRVLLLDPGRAPLRRLAARVLDAAGRLPGPAVVRAVLGERAATQLAPALVYTRARHLDLIQLVRRPGAASPLAASLPAVVACCGDRVAHDLIAEFGWSRVNLGLTAQRRVGLSVDGSMPFVMTPQEAELVASCGGARRAFEHVVAVAHGGTVDEAGARTGDPVIARFRAYNLAHAGVLGDLLDIAPLTVARVETILGKMDHLTSEFVQLFAGRSDECQALPPLYDALKRRIHEEIAGARGDHTLSVEATRLVQMFEDPPTLADVRTLHGLKRYLHQRGLALGFGLLKASQATNRTVDLALVTDGRVDAVTRKIEYVDVEPDEGAARDAPEIPYAVAVVADAFARHLLRGRTSLPRVRIFCYGTEVHYFVSFRNHPVFIRIDYSPPLSGGMIDLAYYGVSKFELDSHPGVGLEGIQTVLRRLDFLVEVENTRIHARYDKERAVDLADLCAKAEALVRLAPHLMDVDWTIGSLDLPEDARRLVADAWADYFDRWGTLPDAEVLTADRRGILAAREQRPEGAVEVRWTGTAPYADILSGRPRPTWPAEVHAAAAARGLEVPLLASGGEAGQLRLEAQVLSPLRDAVGRGAIVVGPDGFRRASPDLFQALHEADAFAELLSANDDRIAASARLARLATALERTLRFETTGSVNGYDVQRAALVLRQARGAIYGLRDGTGIFRLAMFTLDGALFRRRADPAVPWSDNVSLDVAHLSGLLRRNAFLPSWIDVSVRAEDDARHVRATFAAPGPRALGTLPGERVVSGLKAAPGRGAGLARLGTRGRAPADLDGGVLIAATLTPEDSVFLSHAVAVVGTGGGILSHAGLMAVQFGRPALVVPGEWRGVPGGPSSLICRRTEFETLTRTVAGCVVVERRHVREHEEPVTDGDLVVADADAGTLSLLGQGQTALALHDALRGLALAGRRLAQAAGPVDVLVQRGHRLRALHQLARLLARPLEPALVRHAVRELLGGDAASAAGGEKTDLGNLLRVLLGNPACGDVADRCMRQLVRDVAERCATACVDARRLIPNAATAHDVLALRMAVARQHALLEQAAALTGAIDGALSAECAAVESLAHARLAALYEQVASAVRAAGAAGGTSETFRHELRQARQLAAAVGAPVAEQDALAHLAQRLADRDRSVIGPLSSRAVLWPEDAGFEIEPLAGAKAANLAELHRLGAAALVPPWFVVTDRAFRDVLAVPAPGRPSGPWSPGRTPASLGDAIDAVIERDDADERQKAALVRQLWEDVRLPVVLCEEVTAAYARLARRDDRTAPPSLVDRGLGSRILGIDRRASAMLEVPPDAAARHAPDAPYVAIRSSAREEDTQDAVGAGQFDTFLFVRGTDAVLRFLRRAWSGLWTARAIHDRQAAGRSARAGGGGVLVQRIAWSRVSGVLQTINVAAGRTREMVVNVGLGLGEGIVSGAVAADLVVVSKDEDPFTEPIRFRYVAADKRERVIFDARAGTGTVRADVLAHQRLRPALEYAELVALVQVATRLEAAYGHPLDIEFGFEGAALWILQVRPVPGLPAMWREFTKQGTGRARGRE
jgi:hypothetical protein